VNNRNSRTEDWLERVGQDSGTNRAEEAEVELAQALSNFRQSVHAWSDAAYFAPRRLPATTRHRVWRLAAGWALGGVLVAAALSGGFFERYQGQKRARVEAARQAQQLRFKTEQQAREEDELLAKVDTDVAREVPSAMEPLAQLMVEDESK